jgi:hypothetical protein
MHSSHPPGQLGYPGEHEKHSKYQLERSASRAGLEQRARQATQGTGDSEASYHPPIHVPAEQPETLGCANGVGDSDGSHRELGPDLQGEDRCQQTANPEPADGGHATRQNSRSRQDQV